MEMRPRETARVSRPSANPVMVTVAAPFAEWLLIAAQIWGSGFQVCAAACSGVSMGGTAPTQRGSISPNCMRSPLDFTCMRAAPPANSTSIRQSVALASASRHKNAGGGSSGGKMDPSAGQSMVMGATLCGRGPAAAAIAAAMHNQSEQVLNSFTLNLYFTWEGGL